MTRKDYNFYKTNFAHHDWARYIPMLGQVQTPLLIYNVAVDVNAFFLLLLKLLEEGGCIS